MLGTKHAISGSAFCFSGPVVRWAATTVDLATDGECTHPSAAAMERNDWPFTTACEICSRSAKVSALGIAVRRPVAHALGGMESFVDDVLPVSDDVISDSRRGETSSTQHDFFLQFSGSGYRFCFLPILPGTAQGPGQGFPCVSTHSPGCCLQPASPPK